MRTNFLIALLFTVIIVPSTKSFSQETENELQTRTNLGLSFEPFEKVKFTLNPELRFDEKFSLDIYLIEGETEYKISKHISVSAQYDLVGNLRDNNDTEYFGRYAISVELQKELGRFEPSFRIMYSNYSDDDVDDKNYLRYKAGLKYDIRDCKITPFASVQLFQDLNGKLLHKTRYAIGADYKLSSNNYIGISYKLDYYNTEYLNKHIINLGYKIKF